MRKNTLIVLLTVFALALAPAVGLACEGDKTGCSHEKAAKLAALTDNAKKGCEKSQAKLIAIAKESGCEKTAALATKAEEGDEKAMQKLITMYHEKAVKVKAKPTGADLAALAKNAEAGCEKSEAKLIAHCKKSGCEKTAALAAKAEAGCEKSKAKLIAMTKEEAAAAETKK